MGEQRFKPGDKVRFIKKPDYIAKKDFKFKFTDVLTILRTTTVGNDVTSMVKECPTWWYDDKYLELAMPDIFGDD